MEPSADQRGLDRWIIWTSVTSLALVWTLFVLAGNGLDLTNANGFVSFIVTVSALGILFLGLILAYLVAAYKKG